MQPSRYLALLVVLLVAGLGVTMVVTGDTTRQDNANGSNVSVGAGDQLSTILSTTDDDVRTDIEEAGIEVEYERSTDAERAETLADRAEALRERAQEIREEYEELTEEYEEGEITADQYAQQLAILNNRAENVLDSLDSLQGRADNVSQFDLRAAGFDTLTLENASEQLADLSGTGPAALLERFTGQRTGELEIETGDGLRIEVENEDGESSREIRYPDDGNNSMTVAQSDALESARNQLSDRDGNWTLTDASVHADSGYYNFEFALESPSLDGESEIRIDGSSGEPLRIEEEIEPLDDEDEADDDDEGDDEADDDEGEDDADDGDEADEEDDEQDEDLFILVSDGVVQPNETVTLQVQSPAGPVENATVSLDDEVVGQTDATGSIDLTLPSGEFEIEATHGDAEAEIEFEFESEQESESDAVARNVTIDATLENRTVTVQITHDGEPIPDVAVDINGEDAGVTDAAGEASGTIDADSEEVDVEFERGEFEAESTYEIHSGDLVQTSQQIEFGDEVVVDNDGDDDDETDEDADSDDEAAEDDTESGDDSDDEADDDDSDTDDSDDDEEVDDDS